MRFLAICAIVCYHSIVPVPGVTYSADPAGMAKIMLWSALPLLFIVSGFAHGASRGADETPWLVRRLAMLLWVYAVWTVIYSLFGILRHAPWPGIARVVAFGLAWGHLWYLPALCACTLLTFAGERMRVRPAFMLAASLALAAVYVTLVWGWRFDATIPLRTPLFWWFFYVVGHEWSRASCKAAESLQRLSRVALPAVVLLGITAAAVQTFANLPGSFPKEVIQGPTAAIVAVVLFGFATSTGVTRRQVRWMPPLSLPMYLIHPAIITILYWVMVRVGHRLGSSQLEPIVVAAFALAVSVTLAVVLLSIPWTRLLFAAPWQRGR